MNQDQKKYLLKRLEEISGLKVIKLKEKIPQVDTRFFLKKLRFKKNVFPLNKLAIDLMDKLISAARLPNDNKYNSFFSLSEFEMFSNCEEVKQQYEKAKENRENLIKEKKAILDNYVIRLKDEIMLGDSKEALKQLAQFEKMEF